MNFSVIIPNLNGAKLLPSCLKSIKNQEIILIDNASTDQSIAIAQKIHPQIKIIKNSQNLGFAAAVNQGILAASNPYVIVCNNDITLHPGYFKFISQAIKSHPRVATFVGTTLNKTGDQIESTGLNFNYCGQCSHQNHNKKLGNWLLKIGHSRRVWGAAAALVIYKKEIIQKIGLFDPKFFAYEEDVDLALRLHNLNYKTLWVPQALANHLGGATSSKMGNLRNRMDAKNWIYIIIKNYSKKQIWQNLPCIIEQRFRNCSGLLKNTPFLLWLPTLASTYGQVILNLSNMIHKRYQIKKYKIKREYNFFGRRA